MLCIYAVIFKIAWLSKIFAEEAFGWFVSRFCTVVDRLADECAL